MTVTEDTAPYLGAFEQRLPQAEPQWLAAQRVQAAARFGALGFPTRRQEAWRFTDLRPLLAASFPPATEAPTLTPEALAPWRLEGATYRLVLVDGRVAAELSDSAALPKGAWLAGTAETAVARPELLRAALDETDTVGNQAFASLNAALFGDGFVLALEPGVTLDRPVEIIHLGRAARHSFHLRNALILGAGSHAALIESFAGKGEYWTNAVSIVRLAESAALTHIKLQDESDAAIHIAQARVHLDTAARYDSFVLTLGARLSRHDSFVTLAGEHAHCTLDGAYLLRGEREATNATSVDHAAPNGTTREFFKGVLDDRTHGVFLGRVAVRPHAQKTDAHQLNRNLLLSPRAAVDTKPELEILADDVKCAHGATVGDLDEAALFYLLARGIPPEEARRLLVEAFAAEAIERVADPALRDHLGRHVRCWLGRA